MLNCGCLGSNGHLGVRDVSPGEALALRQGQLGRPVGGPDAGDVKLIHYFRA